MVRWAFFVINTWIICQFVLQRVDWQCSFFNTVKLWRVPFNGLYSGFEESMRLLCIVSVRCRNFVHLPLFVLSKKCDHSILSAKWLIWALIITTGWIGTYWQVQERSSSQSIAFFILWDGCWELFWSDVTNIRIIGSGGWRGIWYLWFILLAKMHLIVHVRAKLSSNIVWAGSNKLHFFFPLNLTKFLKSYQFFFFYFYHFSLGSLCSSECPFFGLNCFESYNTVCKKRTIKAILNCLG